MSFTSALVLYAVTWFIVLLMLLPVGVRSQEEAGDVAPGTPAGAPETPMIGRKMLWATGVAAIVWLAIFCVIEFRVITRDDIRNLAPFD